MLFKVIYYKYICCDKKNGHHHHCFWLLKVPPMFKNESQPLKHWDIHSGKSTWLRGTSTILNGFTYKNGWLLASKLGTARKCVCLSLPQHQIQRPPISHCKWHVHQGYGVLTHSISQPYSSSSIQQVGLLNSLSWFMNPPNLSSATSKQAVNLLTVYKLITNLIRSTCPAF